MWIRYPAGGALMLAGLLMGAISGALSYTGFDAMLHLPGAGVIGPAVALGLFAAGVIVELMIKERRWMLLAVFVAVCCVLGFGDWYGGNLALENKVEAAKQADADRLAAYGSAVRARDNAAALVVDMEAERKLMSGDDCAGAQKLLKAAGKYAGKLDAKCEGDTQKAMFARGVEIAGALPEARADVKEAEKVVAKGKPESELPFSVEAAHVYALGLTLGSVVLAFLGSLVAFGLKPQLRVEEVLDAMEAHVGGMEESFSELAVFLAPPTEEEAALPN